MRVGEGCCRCLVRGGGFEFEVGGTGGGWGEAGFEDCERGTLEVVW